MQIQGGQGDRKSFFGGFGHHGLSSIGGPCPEFERIGGVEGGLDARFFDLISESVAQLEGVGLWPLRLSSPQESNRQYEWK